MIGCLFLPFKMAFNLIHILVKLAMSALWLPIHLITRHLFLVFIIAVVIIVFAMFSAHQEDKKANALPQAPTVTVDPSLQPMPVQGAPQGRQQPIKIDPVMKEEEGDSAFSTDLLAAMNEQERAAYSAYFYYAMGSVPNNQSYTWNYGNINGVITPTTSFSNNVGDHCRTFKETLKVHTVRQTGITGTSCVDRNGGWCKLKPNATPMCGIGGGSPDFTESIKDSLHRLFH